jgi:hypothetical protein
MAAATPGQTQTGTGGTGTPGAVIIEEYY